MSELTKIDSEQSLKEFIERVHGLHDSLLHEAVMLHPGFVGDDRRMWGDADLPDVRLIFQSQVDEVTALRVDLRRVSLFQFNPRRELELEGEIRGGEVVLYLTGKEVFGHSRPFEIHAGEVEYQLLGREYLGPEYKLARQDDPEQE